LASSVNRPPKVACRPRRCSIRPASVDQVERTLAERGVVGHGGGGAGALVFLKLG
jgi:hypothetical protein